MMKSKISLALAVMTFAVALSGCGKDKYEGTYTGYEIRSQGTTGTTGTTGTNTAYSSARAVTVTLSNNGDAVTGTYTVTSVNPYGQYYPTGQYPTGQYPTNQYPTQPGTTGNVGAGETYQFTASSAASGSLSNVMLISTGGSYSQFSNCFMQGSLSSQNNGQTISGTLTSAAGAASNCGSLQLSLTRGN